MSVFKIQLNGTYDLDYTVNASSKEEALEKVLSKQESPTSTNLVELDSKSAVTSELINKYKVSIPQYVVYTVHEVFASTEVDARIECGKIDQSLGITVLQYDLKSLSTLIEKID